MDRYCKVCGRRLVKCVEDVGPTCSRKRRPRQRLTKSQKVAIAIKCNIFKKRDNNNEQGKLLEPSQNSEN